MDGINLAYDVDIMPHCPQCRKERSPQAFQFPVRTCLKCYAALPWNRDIEDALYSGDPYMEQQAVITLRQRASNSEFAKKKRRQQVSSEPNWITPAGEFTGASIFKGAERAVERLAEMLACDGCGKKFQDDKLSELLEAPGDVKALLCSRCSENPAGIDKQCALCQKMFPLPAMESDGTKFRCHDCAKRVKYGGEEEESHGSETGLQTVK